MDDPRWLKYFDEIYETLCDSGMDCEEAAEKAGIKADEILLEEKRAERAA